MELGVNKEEHLSLFKIERQLKRGHGEYDVHGIEAGLFLITVLFGISSQGSETPPTRETLR